MQEKEADKITIWMAEKFTRNNTINCLPKNPIMHVIQFINIRIYLKKIFSSVLMVFSKSQRPHSKNSKPDMESLLLCC